MLLFIEKTRKLQTQFIFSFCISAFEKEGPIKKKFNLFSQKKRKKKIENFAIHMDTVNVGRARTTRTPSSRTPDATAGAEREGVPARLNGYAGALMAHAPSAGSMEDVSSECGDQLSDDRLSSTSLLYSAPSCIQDFTERWITEVMRQYYMTQFGQKSPLPDGIGSFSVEMAGNNDDKVGVSYNLFFLLRRW
jgi:hypothetical protein